MSHTLTQPHPAKSRVGQPRSAAPRPTPVRLTLRGRLVVVGLLVLTVLAIAGVGRLGSSAAAADPSQPTSGPVADTWVVQPGETLWSIAQQLAPDVDPRDTVARILELNDLPDSSVEAGTSLFVPAS